MSRKGFTMNESNGNVISNDHSEIMGKIMDTLKEIESYLDRLDVHFPIQSIAYLEMRQQLHIEGIIEHREYILEYLEKGYRFKKFFWSFIEKTYNVFGSEMKRDGNHFSNSKFFKALQIDFYMALFDVNKSTWIKRFDDYVPRMREMTGQSGVYKGRNGKKFISEIKERLGNEISGALKWRDEFLENTKKARTYLPKLPKQTNS